MDERQNLAAAICGWSVRHRVAAVVSQPDRGTVWENAFVKSIPLNTRNPMLLLNLTPGVTGHPRE